MRGDRARSHGFRDLLSPLRYCETRSPCPLTEKDRVAPFI